MTILLVILLVAVGSATYAQNSSWTGWSQWMTSSCYKGIDFRINTNRTSTGEYEARLEFRNRYYKTVSFQFEAQGGSKTTSNNYVNLEPGGTDNSYIGSSFTSDRFRILVDELKIANSNSVQPCDH